MDDGCGGVEEGKLLFPGEFLDGGGERGRGERAGGNDDARPLGRRQARALAPPGRDPRGGRESSGGRSVLRAAGVRPGRISCSTTGRPASAICQAASEPASPPPMM